jgi:hypothetical protein
MRASVIEPQEGPISPKPKRKSSDMTPRHAVRNASIAGLFLALFVATASAASPDKDRLLIGCDINPGTSQAAMDLFFECGMNFARVSGGGYDWALEGHRKLVPELGQHGVQVLLQLGSHYPSAEYFKFKDSYFVDQDGKTGVEDRNAWAVSYSGNNWPQYSYASQEIRPQFEKNFASYLDNMKGFTNIQGIILHNEPGLFWMTDRLFDYSAPALKAWAAWLKARYGTVDALNKAWGTSYASFEAAEAPRKLPPVENVAQWLDWRRANAAFIGDFMQWEISFARKAWPDMPVTTNLAGPLDWWFPWRCADNDLLTRGMDFAGIDLYPGRDARRFFPAYGMDMTRGVAGARPSYVIECDSYDSGQWSKVTAAQRAALLRSEVWTYIGHGARGILIWGLSGHGGFGLTDGAYNGRIEAMREAVHLSDMLHLGAYHSAPRQVAVVVDPDVYVYYAATGKEPPYWLDMDCQGIYAAVTQAGYGADVIFADQVRAGDAGRYRALVLASPVMADQKLADALKGFVHGGGLLIAEAPLGEVDEHGGAVAAPGLGLDEVFGIKTAASGKEPQTISAGNYSISASRVRREVTPSGAQVIGRFADGSAAVTANDYGSGRAVYLASCVGFPYGEGWGDWASPGLSGFIGEQVARSVPSAPGLNVLRGKAYLDAAGLVDDAGNRAIVLTAPQNRGTPPVPVKDVALSLTAGEARGLQGMWLVRPGEVADGVSVAGPQQVPVAGGQTTVPVGTVDSMAVLLLARDAAPLLAVSASDKAAAGAKVDVQVTVGNPSPRPLAGKVSLVLPKGLTAPEGGSDVQVPAGGTAQVTLTATLASDFQSGSRHVVKASFQPSGGGQAVLSVPVDVYVQ